MVTNSIITLFNFQLQYVDTLIKQKRSEQERINKEPRRACTLSDYAKGSQDVLGKVSLPLILYLTIGISPSPPPPHFTIVC